MVFMKPGKSFIVSVSLSCLLPIFIRNNEYFLHIYIICAVNIILANSLRAIAISGQMSIGQAGFMAIGAYTSAILASKLNFPIYGSLAMGGLASMAVAGFIGYPLSRLRTVYFVMVTMFLGEVIRLLIFEWRSVTGGSTGMMGIPRPGAFSVFGVLHVDFAGRFEFCYLALAVLTFVLVVLYRLERSQLGIALAGVGQEDTLASSVGINVAKHKVLIFCIGSFCTGLAGALYAHYMTVLNPDSFGTFASLYILVYVVVGGKKFAGPVAGAILLTIIPEVASGLKEYQPFVFVLVLFLVIFLLPGGLSDLHRHSALRTEKR
jgi:branched-chain amino acid transport system permease protein